MLASTVQFSNNDQPPTTPAQHGVHRDRHQKRRTSTQPAPSDTQQRARPALLLPPRSTPKQY
jgi:hypothetical protein